MRSAVLLGAVMIGAAFPAIPAVTAPAAVAPQDCAAIIKSLNGLSGEISGHADSYWAQRRAYVEHKSATSPQAQSARVQADAVKALVPKKLEAFAGLVNAAKEQKCLSPERIKELHEATFNAGRAVNFDELPTSESTEGNIPARKTPRMPQN